MDLLLHAKRASACTAWLSQWVPGALLAAAAPRGPCLLSPLPASSDELPQLRSDGCDPVRERRLLAENRQRHLRLSGGGNGGGRELMDGPVAWILRRPPIQACGAPDF